MACMDTSNNGPQGFTIMELIVAVSIAGVLCSVAVPVLSSWVPEFRLKSAVRDLYSNMQLARVMSIKHNDKYRVVFYTDGQGYSIVRPDGTTERHISFRDYDKGGHIGYGAGKATKGATISGGPIPDDGVSYLYNKISFTPRGLGSGMGYAYLENSKGTAYAVGTWITGIIVLKKWNDSTGDWE